MPEPVVIVGAGAAGTSAALALRAGGYDGDLVLLGDVPELPYRRSPLSKDVLTGRQSPARTLLRPAIDLRTGAEATGIRPADRVVTLAVGDGILADAHGATSAPGVLAAGDVARRPAEFRRLRGSVGRPLAPGAPGAVTGGV